MATCKVDGCDGKAVGRGWCGKHYRRWKRHGDPLDPGGRILDVMEKLRRRSRVNPETGCIEWTGAKTDKGYGQCSVDGQMWRVHRLAWTLVNGPIPEGLDVLHSCDNRPCFNEAHLFLGTNDDNMADMVAKGRAADQAGERNPRSKLTDDDIRTIRHRYAAGGISQTALAWEYGVNQTMIGFIVRGEAWTHVEDY